MTRQATPCSAEEAPAIWTRHALPEGYFIYRLKRDNIVVAFTFRSAGYWAVSGPRFKSTYCRLLAKAKAYAEDHA